MKAYIRKLQGLAGLFAAVILIQPQISSAQVDTATISLATKAQIWSKTIEQAAIGRDLAALSAEYELFVQTAGVKIKPRDSGHAIDMSALLTATLLSMP